MIIIRSGGYNGSSTFSILRESDRKPVVKDKNQEELPGIIIEKFPKIAQKIADFYEMDFSGDFPEEMNLSLIGSDIRAKLIKQIAIKLRPTVKV